MPNSDRLSALDAMFVGIETTELHMHVGAVLVFEAGPLANADGGVDFERIASYLETALVHLPNYRRRLKPTPGLRHPVWVDDQHFDMSYHLRHAALPRPGSERLLKRLAGRIFSQSLDRKRPLWEFWVVEGLENNRFALITKVHHAMVDGVAGVGALAGLLRANTDESFQPVTTTWQPEDVPSGLDLLLSELRHRKEGIGALVERARSSWNLVRSGSGEGTKAVASGVLGIIKTGLLPAPATCINPRHVGPHRRLDVCRYDMKTIKAIKNELGGKVNDVILALCAGALRRFLARCGDSLADLEKFRVLMPVSIRGKHKGQSGNQIALSLLDLPLHIDDPLLRYKAILESTAKSKGQSHHAEGTALLEEISDVTADSLMRESIRVAGVLRPYNVIISNIPGPPFDLFLLGARLEEVFPLVPLFYQQGLGIGIFSYAGTLSIGLGADRDAVPNLHELASDFDTAFKELAAVAGLD